MSELMEEPLEEEAKTEAQADQPSPKKGRRGYAMGEIVEGKRAKKTIERLDFQISKPKEKLKIEDGGGDKLGDIPRTNYHIGKMKPVDLKPLHTILFDRPGKMATMRKNMRLFNGFPFEVDSEAYIKKREKMARSFNNSKLRAICKVLDQEKKGTQADLIDRILTFLIAPKNSGKPLLSKKKKKSKKKLSGSDSKGKTKTKGKPKPKSASPKKSKAESKSKAIVMDSSSDEDDEEDDDKVGATAELEGSDTEGKSSKKKDEQSDETEDSEEEDEEEEEEEEEDEDESPKSKPGKGKAASKKTSPVKRQRAPAKKAGPPRKKAKKEVSDQSESDPDSESEVEKPKKKPAAKTKKADSSSNRKKTASKVVEDSSDDDEPLIKMIKKAPSDEQLKETVQSLLKEANLEEMTMKQICQRVYDTYPDHDLTSRKDYIKQTVKTLIS